jgi:predicted anti-sigma-YlaC factor YlaD
VRCVSVREALSAELDNEPATLGREHVDAHLAGCLSCRQWQDLAHVVTRRTRVGSALPTPGLSDRLVAGVRSEVRRRRRRHYWLLFARGVIVAGLLQVLATVPLLVMARGHTSGGGRVHVLGLVELTIGAGFFVGALVVLWRDRDKITLEAVRTAELAAPNRGDARRISEVA